MNKDPASEQTENHYKGLQAKVADAVRLETLLNCEIYFGLYYSDSGPLHVGDDDLHYPVFPRLCST